MSSHNNYDSAINSIFSHLVGAGSDSSAQKRSNNSSSGSKSCSSDSSNSLLSQLTPSKILVIAGLLGDALTVDSISVDRDQNIEIVLIGSLKQKTQLEKVMDQVGKLPFDEVMKSIIGRLV